MSTLWLPTKRGVVGRIAATWTFKVEWVNPAESWACSNSRTVTNMGSWLGRAGGLRTMNWKSHFKHTVSSSEGALDWSMVSTTSVERPETMSCAPSGATHQNFHISGRGWRPPLWEESLPDGNLPWRAVEERNEVYIYIHPGALPAYRAPLGGLSVGRHPLVTRFLQRLRPPARRLTYAMWWIRMLFHSLESSALPSWGSRLTSQKLAILSP